MRITGFGAPTEDELAQDFLWRIEKELSPCGAIGLFDRSHYEDVLIEIDPSDVDERQHWTAYSTPERRAAG